MSSRLTTILILTWVMVLRCAGQDSDAARLAKAYEELRNRPGSGQRVALAKDVAAERNPELVPVMVDGLMRVGQRLGSLEQQIDRQTLVAIQDESQLSKLPASRRDAALEKLQRGQGDLLVLRTEHGWLFDEAKALQKGVRDSIRELGEPKLTVAFTDMIARIRSEADSRARLEGLRVCAQFPREDCRVAIAADLTAKEPRLRLGAVDCLGIQGLPESEAGVLPLLEDPADAVRLSALRALKRVGGADAITAAIGRLSKERGLLLDESIATLEALTGVSFHESALAWTDWWERSKLSWKRPTAGKRDGAKKGEPENLAHYYGIQFRAESVVYLLDVSGSMNEPALASGVTGQGPKHETKLERAKRELIRSLESLPVGTRVNVTAYSDRAQSYAPELLKLDATTRRALVAWVRALTATGETNLYDPVEALLMSGRGSDAKLDKRIRVETVFLLTDGIPTAGRLRTPSEITREIARQNEMARLVLHTIGVGPDHSKELLKGMAEATGGRYVAAP